MIRTSGVSNTDPDLRLYRALPSFAFQGSAISSISDTEIKSFNLISGSSYLLDIYDDKEIADTCYEVSVTLL